MTVCPAEEPDPLPSRPSQPSIEPAAQPCPLLSVVVPFYNVEAYVADCLESIRSQLLTDIEVIVVDDGSTDGSLAIVERFVAADPRFRLIRQENQGLGPARNAGTRAARGRYLTFVDSDDLVAPRSYTSMVGTLEQTGSSFAAGNAYRFSGQKGVYQSWTHREPFRKTKLRTSLDRYVPLVKDRMVWNKVFRRSFWDANGYEFPAIRYEDYPVTLRAYLEAETVDILAGHVYLWRDRESGDSITQQAADGGNARERYVSASMVLDILARHEATDDVRNAVEAYFIHIDLVSLAQSMVSVPEADRPELERMALQLANMLSPVADKEVTRLARLVHHRLLAGDIVMVRELARWRLNGDTRTLARNLAVHPKPLALPLALGAVLRRNRLQNPLRPRRLRCALLNAEWDGPILRLSIEAQLRPDLAGRSIPSARLRAGRGHTMPVAISASHLTESGLVIDLEIDTRKAQKLSVAWRRAELVLGLRVAALNWVGRVRFTPDQLPGAHQLSDGSWLQPRGRGLHLGLARLRDPAVIERVEADGPRFLLHPGRSTSGRTITVRRPDPTADLQISFGVGPGVVDAASLFAGDPPDNPVTGVAERSVVIPAPHLMEPLHVPDDFHEDDLVTIQEFEDVFLAGSGAKIRVGDVDVSFERGWCGNLVVRQAPVVPRGQVSL